MLAYHAATKHSLKSVQSSTFRLDWANQPLPFKIYTSLGPLGLPYEFTRSPLPRLDRAMLARLCYFSNGVTKVLRGMPFRAAACTGALYHIELYLICSELEDLEAGVYHYSAHDNALRQLRRGDYRALIGSAPVSIVLTSTFWRNAWKYESRAYRHAFWDSGTILANLFAVASAAGIDASLHVAFADDQVNALLDIDPSKEASVAVVALGSPGAPPTSAPAVPRLNLPTRPLSAHEVDYPRIREAHAASSLEAAAWPMTIRSSVARLPGDEPIESVILRRGSSRRFTHDPIPDDALRSMLEYATQAVSSDVVWPLTDVYVIANAVDGRAPGTYVVNRPSRQLELLESGQFRREAGFLSIGQALAGDAAFNVYWLSDLRAVLERLGGRGYRAAQLEAAIEGGRLYLAAYALGLGATGLTFFDDEVVRFFSPHASGKEVMFLTAVGHPARRR